MTTTPHDTLETTFTFRDGRTVSRIGLGTMRLTGQPGNFGPYHDLEAGRRLLGQAVDLGVQHFDTARSYGPHHAERLVGAALSGRRHEVFIASKGGMEKTGTGPDGIRRDARPATLARHVEESLANLGVESIDLYYLHRPDDAVPLEDSVGALARAREQGRIERIGLSNVTLDELEHALRVAPVDAVQNRYNPTEGGDEALIDFTRDRGIAFVPWGPLGAHPMRHGTPLAGAGRDALGRTPVQAALAYLLERAPNILPVPGTTNLAHLVENLAAATLHERAAA